jgi:glutathione S-transferase
MRLGIFLAEKGIDIETEHVDLMAREQFNESFRTVNSWGTVPALLLDDGEVLTEVVGMYSYLEDIYPQIPLLGSEPLSRALILSWDHRCFTDGFQAVAEVLRNSAPGFAGRALPGPVSYEQISELADRGNERIQAFYGVLNKHLEGREFMVGDNFTVADIDAYVFVKFSSWVKATIPDECTHLRTWHQQISTRESVQS